VKPQTAAVLRALRGLGSLTPHEARFHLGCDRLAARVAEIRDEYGRASVEKITEVAITSHGEKRFARYVWRGAP